METEKTISLRKPIIVNDVEKSEITLTEPTAGQLEESSKESTSTGTVIKMIQLQTKWPRKSIGSLCNRDFVECASFLGSFNDTETPDLTGEDSKTSE